MGVPLYTEPGRNGGYRLLDNRTLPPIIFNENEDIAIFFAFQALKYYKSLPFTIDLKAVSRKLSAYLPADTRDKIARLDSVLSFWNKKRGISAPFLKEIIAAAIENRVLKIDYQSKHQNTNRKYSGCYTKFRYSRLPSTTAYIVTVFSSSLIL
jgi:predicted DNA-binding transcriptional regulator YafY